MKYYIYSAYDVDCDAYCKPVVETYDPKTYQELQMRAFIKSNDTDKVLMTKLRIVYLGSLDDTQGDVLPAHEIILDFDALDKEAKGVNNGL